MGTRSRIGYELADHSVVSSYCQYDGYPEFNGKILVKYYQNREDIKELIDGGSMSSIKTRQTWTSGPSLRDENDKIITDSEGYPMYENDRDPQPKYHSERGDGEEPTHTSFKKFVSGDSCEEYAYLYTLEGKWQCYKIGWGEEPTELVEIPSELSVA
jgi:hypothetical protein